MSLFRLIRRNVMRHPVRSLLTLGAALVAMFLLVFLRSVLTTLDDSVKSVATNRIVTQSAVSLFVNLPASYQPKIEGIEGVESVCRFQWFGGVYKEPQNFFAQFAVDPETMLAQYDECQIPADQAAAFKADRRGCIIGETLAERFGWKIGDRVPILGTIFTKEGAWEFDVRGIYRSERANFDAGTMYFHFDYLDEMLESEKAEGPRGVGVFIVKLSDEADPVAVSDAIDALFAGGPQRTRTQTEAAFQAGFITMLGNVPSFLGWIGGAVFFALALTLINAMLISSSERIRDTGVMKALGFSNRTCGLVYLGESLLLSLTGGLLGLGLGYLTVQPMRQTLGSTPGIALPFYDVRTDTAVMAVAAALLIGLLAGIAPALRAARLDPAEALRAEV
ncbi:MAG: ABC transporter permease [Planctomycetota bacterium]